MVYNVRSPEQWEIISKQVDFKGKTVLDLGCGKGDILCRAFGAGAEVVGIDNDQDNIGYIHSVHPEVKAIFGDLERLAIDHPSACHNTDIIICFSVLPYLVEPGYWLNWMNCNSNIVLIECQYDGDGPGFYHLRNNSDMRRWLKLAGFKKVQPIGHTLVEGRNKKRYIWMCE